jgi:hypothetical protein
MLTAHNALKKRTRLTREIAHFSEQLQVFGRRSTPQEKRCHTRALRALQRRTNDLVKLVVS